MKDQIGSLESEISFLRSEIKEKNTLISSLISLRSTECSTEQHFLVTNSYKNSSDENKETHCRNNGRISNDVNPDSIYKCHLDTETRSQPEIITLAEKIFTKAANIA